MDQIGRPNLGLSEALLPQSAEDIMQRTLDSRDYVSFVYLVSWLQAADGMSPTRALEINSVSMALLLPVMIAAGLLSDRFGRKPVLLLATFLGLVGAVPA